jgi:hypothetical protein
VTIIDKLFSIASAKKDNSVVMHGRQLLLVSLVGTLIILEGTLLKVCCVGGVKS